MASTDPSVHLLIRVWLPNRPGALGLVASRIGACRGDIIGIDVLEASPEIAVDEFAVSVADESMVDVMIKEIAEVDGCNVESVSRVTHFPDPRTDAIASAASLLEASDRADLLQRLTSLLCAEFTLDWAAVVGDHSASCGTDLPTVEVLAALATGAGASASLRAGETGPDDLAVAFLAHAGSTLLAGRAQGPFRRRERAQIRGLAIVADRCWDLIS